MNLRTSLPAYLGDVPRSAGRSAAPGDRGHLPRRAGQRDRRPGRQPARSGRPELHRRRRLRLVAGRARRRLQATWPPARATSWSAAAPTCTTASPTTCCSPPLRRCRPTGRCRTVRQRRRRHRPRRGRRRAWCSSDWPTPSATATAIYAVVKGRRRLQRRPRPGPDRPAAGGPARGRCDRAYAEAGISPRDVGLVEAHGTGTVVGDRTELRDADRASSSEAGARPGGMRDRLGQVADRAHQVRGGHGRRSSRRPWRCTTGVLPPTLHLERPNPAWDPETSPFVFHTAASPWATPAEERVAGVSAFGFGGTNFHAVLASARRPAPTRSTPSRPGRRSCSVSAAPIVRPPDAMYAAC